MYIYLVLNVPKINVVRLDFLGVKGGIPASCESENNFGIWNILSWTDSHAIEINVCCSQITSSWSSKTLPRELKLTNQKIPFYVDTRNNWRISKIKKKMYVASSDPDDLLYDDILSSTFWILGKYDSRLGGKLRSWVTSHYKRICINISSATVHGYSEDKHKIQWLFPRKRRIKWGKELIEGVEENGDPRLEAAPHQARCVWVCRKEVCVVSDDI